MRGPVPAPVTEVGQRVLADYDSTRGRHWTIRPSPWPTRSPARSQRSRRRSTAWP